MLFQTVWYKNLGKRKKSISASWNIEEAAMPVDSSFLSMLNKELSRVRRFEHPLTIAVIRQIRNGASYDKPLYNKQKARPQQTIYALGTDIKPISLEDFINFGLIVENSIREIDMIGYDRKNHQFIICFPETNKDQADCTIKRIKKIIGNSMADQLSFGLSEFPENGLILDGLIEHAVLGCNS